jgi:O-antigen ligase
MSESSPSAAPLAGAPTADAVWRWGRILLGVGLTLLLALTLAVATVAPLYAPLVPLALAGALGVAWVARRPLLHLCLVLLSLLFVLDTTEGVRVSELAVSLYYPAYLAGWFVHHVAVRRQRLLADPVDYGVAAFLGLATLALGLTVVYGGDLVLALNEWRRILALAFYFPLKWACLRDPRAFRVLLGVFLVLALILVARNLLRYYFAFQSAEALWEIMTNRSRINERFIMAGFLGSLMFLFHTHAWRHRLLLAGTTFVLLAGTIAGLSRALWIAAAFGLLVAFLLIGQRQRVRLVLLLGGATVGMALAAMLLFDDAFSLVVEGLAARFATLETAASKDLSLVNRFYEWGSAWERILEAPVLGHGLGVKYPHFNIIYKVTETKTFVHNSYLGLLFRHGVAGLACVGFVVLVSFGRAVHLIRTRPGGLSYPLALTCVTVVPALAVAALAEDLLLTLEGAFTLAFLAALVTALWVQRPAVSPARLRSS